LVLGLAALGGAFFKKESNLKPHRIRFWLTAKPDPAFDEKCAAVCRAYGQALKASAAGHRTVSIDEMTGIQALERIAPNLPMTPGRVERREFEYRRHGTQTLIAAFDVASGEVVGQIGDTRNEEDFARFLEQTIAAGPQASGWTIIADNLNIHLSESVVRLVARHCHIDEASLGEKGQERCPQVHAQSPGLLARPKPSHHVPLHPQARVLAQSDRNLVLHPGQKGHPPRKLHLNRRP
jgi:hypothetical protein